MNNFKFDEIGYWSEIKLDIINEYASAYSKIISAQAIPLYHFYIDAFSGAGLNISKQTGEHVQGSPINAIQIHPPFKEYHFIDLDEKKIKFLEDLSGSRNDVFIYHGDCNQILLEQIFPKVKFEDYRRALCVLDPYGLHLSWEVLLTAGKMKTFDIFLNFPIMDINRNALRRDPEETKSDQIDRMNRFWGDDSWRETGYIPSHQMTLLGDLEKEKVTNEVFAEEFRRRLERIAGFRYVPKPIPMRNSRNAVVYYLFFAAHKPAAANIVNDIFKKYADRKN